MPHCFSSIMSHYIIGDNKIRLHSLHMWVKTWVLSLILSTVLTNKSVPLLKIDTNVKKKTFPNASQFCLSMTLKKLFTPSLHHNWTIAIPIFRPSPVFLNSPADGPKCSRKDADITPVLASLHWLPVHFITQFKTLLMAFKALSGQVGPILYHRPNSLPLSSSDS